MKKIGRPKSAPKIIISKITMEGQTAGGPIDRPVRKIQKSNSIHQRGSRANWDLEMRQ